MNAKRFGWFRIVRLCFLLLALTVTVYPQSQTRTGYAVLRADTGYSIPVASALFAFTNSSGVLVSEAGVRAAEPMASGRICVDQEPTETGVALVNGSLQSADVTLILRNAAGTETGRKS